MIHRRQLLAALFSISYLIASGGKITGRITSMETEGPLLGVNVLVEEVSLGAATDVNGEYVILNVSPGSYTLRAEYIGYGYIPCRVFTGKYRYDHPPGFYFNTRSYQGKSSDSGGRPSPGSKRPDGLSENPHV